MSLRAIIWCAVSTKSQTDDDKISLPQQEADARAVCEVEGWQIVDVLRVPGHSRRYVDIHECAADMRQQGIYAFDRLLLHWAARDFDVLIVRDGDRFARTQSLHAYVTESTIDINARLYSLSDGWIDERNYRMWISMSGYKAASHIDFLVNAYKAAHRQKLDKGVALGSRPPFSHEDVRDPATGKRIGLRVKQSLLRMWHDAAELLLLGTPWYNIGEDLKNKYGHVRKNGKRYGTTFFYANFTRPSFWGHSASGIDDLGKQTRGPWVFDPAVPAPDHVTIFYDTHDPVFTGELAERIKAELRRRFTLRGNASPSNPYRFSGLMVCVNCGFNMSGHNRQNEAALKNTYYCKSKYRKDYPEIGCPSLPYYIHEPDAQAWIDARLRALLAGAAAFVPDDVSRGEIPLADQIAALQAEIAADEATLSRLVLQAAQQTDPALVSAFHAAMNDAAELLRAKQSRLNALRHRQPSHALEQDARRAQDEIATLTLDTFWQLSDREINQLLRRLLGDLVLVVGEGEIVGIIDRNAAG